MSDIPVIISKEQATGLYLTKIRKTKVVHLWTGTDTVCRMYSTNPSWWRNPDWVITTAVEHKSVCSMCADVAVKLQLDV